MRIARTVTIAVAGLAVITALTACGGGVEGSAQAAANKTDEAVDATADAARDVSSTEPDPR